MSKRREATAASVPAARRGDALDVRELPSYGFGHRSLMWWGTAGMIAIEGTAFAFMIVVYFYLRTNSSAAWPPSGPPPDLLWGTLNAVLIVASALPNTWTDRAAIDHDKHKVRVGIVTLCVIGLLLVIVRALEFTRLNVGATENAYGSAVWVLLGLHTFNLVTDWVDCLVLAAVMFKEPVEGKRFVDIAENSGYWDFVVATWLPIYAVIYWAPRF